MDDNSSIIERGSDFPHVLPGFVLFDATTELLVDRTKQTDSWLLRIAEAGLAGDNRKVELVVIRAIRSLKADSPATSSNLGSILAQYASNPEGVRSAAGPPPVDSEEGMALVRTENVDDARTPVLPAGLDRRIRQFVGERRENAKLLAEGFLPPGSVLLTGVPGTGKTMLARWIANQLELPFVTLDLATTISSFLGKTGFNLRRTLDYARARPCVLLLDEFDAIAKRRDDATDVGELKRIVNVLLKELEDWPIKSVLIAATNHPELLDRAIQRRFDLKLDLPLPGEPERVEILRQAAARFVNEIPANLLIACAKCLEGASGSELHHMMVASIRQHLVSNSPLIRGLVEDLGRRTIEPASNQNVGGLIREFHNAADGGLTVRELAEIFQRSTSTIQHHLKREISNG